ncbi:hypothetical protein GVN18_42555 [Pseudomonas sp. ODNR1LW]|nr:hypothetical protein [Pseudomonas sp. ODNR1LW]
MNRLSLPTLAAIGAAVGAAGLVGFAAMAQDRPAAEPSASGRALPVGAYRETCRQISLNGDRLRARCIAKDGQSISSTLSVRSCQGARIENDNGRLACAAPAARAT